MDLLFPHLFLYEFFDLLERIAKTEVFNP